MSAIKRLKGLIQEFGVRVTIAKTLQTVTHNIPCIGELTGKIKYSAITDYLYRENKDILEEYNRKKHTQEGRIGDGNVWILWWQGLEAVPEMVRVCIESIKRNIGARELVILDSKNYELYTTVDSRYITMMETGEISKTQFSDILRLNLLYNRGGYGLMRPTFLQGCSRNI